VPTAILAKGFAEKSRSLPLWAEAVLTLLSMTEMLAQTTVGDNPKRQAPTAAKLANLASSVARYLFLDASEVPTARLAAHGANSPAQSIDHLPASCNLALHPAGVGTSSDLHRRIPSVPRVMAPSIANLDAIFSFDRIQAVV
jgi:hypothetical protein